MRKKLLLNDVHLGTHRSGGTTASSALELKRYLASKLRELMMKHLDKDIIILGDLFDAFNVMLSDALEFYYIAADWIRESTERDTAGEFRAEYQPSLTLVSGNHDVSKDSSKMSSFDFVATILATQFPGRVAIINREPKFAYEGIYVIPHMPNQEMFDLELSRVPGDACLVLVHANYHNGFAIESDHSLNVSEEQARRITTSGNLPDLVFAHEHQARTALNGKVIVTGNQWPSSIADCLHNPDGLKHAHIIELSDTATELNLVPVCTWAADERYHEIAWDELFDQPVDRDPDFVRVCGRATAEQAADVIAAVSKYRQMSRAFVVANDVRIEGISDMPELQVSAEQVKAFDVLGYLLENLEPTQAEAVKRLLAEEDQPMKEAA